jgi:hypothetical protein
MMPAAEYESLYNPVPHGQNVSGLVGRDLVRQWAHADRDRTPHAAFRVIVDCPIPNRHLQMALV